MSEACTPTKSRSWRDVLKVHPAAEAFPLMAKAELIELGNDIKNNGLKSPITLMEGQGNGFLLDGRNRLDAMELVGIDVLLKDDPNKMLMFGPPVTIQHAKANIDVESYVDFLNLHRRHLTIEQRRKRIETRIKADPTKSDRAIAAEEKTDHHTIGAARKRMESTGEIPQFAKRRGMDGKSRTAKPREPSKSQLVRVVAPVTRAEDGPITTAITLEKAPTDRVSADGIPAFLDRRGAAHVAELIVKLHRETERINIADRRKAVELAVDNLGDVVKRHDYSSPSAQLETTVLSLALDTEDTRRYPPGDLRSSDAAAPVHRIGEGLHDREELGGELDRSSSNNQFGNQRQPSGVAP